VDASTSLSCFFLSFSLLPINAQEIVHHAHTGHEISVSAAPRGSLGSNSVSSVAASARQASPLIVIGFMGGRVRADNSIHSEASLASELQHDYPNQIYAKVFANRDGKRAYRDILQTLDVDQDGRLNQAEKQNARIIIYGHSWGASETVSLARRLSLDGIAVLLTVQVDSIAKGREEDASIPANVVQAVNFYQPAGLLHGRKAIHAVDPKKTRIIGNFQLSYRDHHIQCSRYPWYARMFMKPHIEIENDPRVWEWIEAMIQAELRGSSPGEAR
jgi:hypothetical protein